MGVHRDYIFVSHNIIEREIKIKFSSMTDRPDNSKLETLELQTKKYIKESLQPIGVNWQEQMRVDKTNLGNRIDTLQKSLQQYERKLDILQRDATELTAAYEKQSASIESDLDSKTVFQSILDHKLNSEDLTTRTFF